MGKIVPLLTAKGKVSSSFWKTQHFELYQSSSREERKKGELGKRYSIKPEEREKEKERERKEMVGTGKQENGNEGSTSMLRVSV